MIKGITFDEQTISAANMGHFMNVFSGHQSGVTGGCELTHDTSNMYIGAGYMLISGRQVQIIGTQTIPFVTVASGELYCLTVFQIDLSKTNTESDFLQGTIETLTSSSGYPVPQQDDLDNGGTIYQLPIARYHASVSGVDSFQDMLKNVAVDWLPASKLRLVGTTLYIDE
ncbi:MAG TPA: hypothetical protein DCF66_03780 [Lachnospiraceae bacterium]|nr:hypothetical protein [Lachnospiraceae bacterium]